MMGPGELLPFSGYVPAVSNWKELFTVPRFGMRVVGWREKQCTRRRPVTSGWCPLESCPSQQRKESPCHSFSQVHPIHCLFVFRGYTFCIWRSNIAHGLRKPYRWLPSLIPRGPILSFSPSYELASVHRVGATSRQWFALLEILHMGDRHWSITQLV